MINITKLKLIQLAQKQELPKEEEIEEFKSLISTYKYPIGIFTDNVFNSMKFFEDTVEHAITYINELASLLLSDYYTQEELLLCAHYFIYQSTLRINSGKKVFKIIPNIGTASSKKAEIQYIIEELQYRYILYLLNTDSQNPLIAELLTKLELVEKEHNAFDLGEKA